MFYKVFLLFAMKKGSAPGNDTDYGKLWVKDSDGYLYFQNASGNRVLLSGMNTMDFEYFNGDNRPNHNASEYLLMLWPKKTNKVFFNISNYADELITGYMGLELPINDFVYNSFLYITLGCFGIAGVEKVMGGKSDAK